MNLQTVKAFLRGSITNFGGQSLKQKLIIFESDDWGAIRTPSREAVKAFQEKGLEIGEGVYRYDALASEDDLSLLFELLNKYTGADGNPAKITANSIMANPDFNRIKQASFKEYHYEKFTETFKRYPKHKNNLEIWKQGMISNVFQPQFHGREHLNIKRWLNVLQSGNEAALFCFDWETTYSGKDDYSFMEAFDWDIPDDVRDHIDIIKDGMETFENVFGYSSRSFIAPCYNWDSRLEPEIKELGIQWIQGIRNQYHPTGSFGNYLPVKHAFGETNTNGIRYNIRNCLFEPSMNKNRDWVDTCLAQIKAAFLLGKPAVISSHRINYVGYIDENNRDNGLQLLNELLKKIISKWPDVKFISTDQLNTYIDD